MLLTPARKTTMRERASAIKGKSCFFWGVFLRLWKEPYKIGENPDDLMVMSSGLSWLGLTLQIPNWKSVLLTPGVKFEESKYWSGRKAVPKNNLHYGKCWMLLGNQNGDFSTPPKKISWEYPNSTMPCVFEQGQQPFRQPLGTVDFDLRL